MYPQAYASTTNCRLPFISGTYNSLFAAILFCDGPFGIPELKHGIGVFVC